MTDWREHAHLFTNGKFKALYNGRASNIDNITHLEGKKYSHFLRDSNDGKMVSVFFCTLIARPISDMTDEEVKKYPVRYAGGETLKPNQKWIIEEEADEDKILGRCERYLLSIGVYPFNQSHFEDGTVLNINEV